jgi:hypothetical protein
MHSGSCCKTNMLSCCALSKGSQSPNHIADRTEKDEILGAVDGLGNTQQ